MRIVFLCSGNTCRSPMAEGIFKKMIIEGDLSFADSNGNIEVSSAGFSTYSGEEIAEYAVYACRRHGIDLSDYRTTNISDIDFDNVDLVLTATVENREKIKKFYPDVNAYTIKEYSGLYEDLDSENPSNALDINDPSGGGLGDYVICYFKIKEALENILKTHKEFIKKVEK